MKKMSAFTLIELLIVLAIIALLCGILFLAYNPARSKGKEAACINNLRSIHQALMIYRQDYDALEPESGVKMIYSQLGLPPTHNFAVSLKSYFPNTAILKCPAWSPTEEEKNYLWSYYWGFPEEGSGPSFAAGVVKMGARVPIVVCDVHNDAKIRLGMAPRWEKTKLLLVRFDGSVNTVFVEQNTNWPFEK